MVVNPLNGRTPVISSAPLMTCQLEEQNIVDDVEESFTKLGSSKFCKYVFVLTICTGS